MLDKHYQGRNHRENLVATSAMHRWAESAPHGGDRVKVSENLGATAVAPVAPVDTSLRRVFVRFLEEFSARKKNVSRLSDLYHQCKLTDD